MSFLRRTSRYSEIAAYTRSRFATPGFWKVAAELYSWQNYHITGHEPFPCAYGFYAKGDKTTPAERRQRRKEDEEAHRARGFF